MEKIKMQLFGSFSLTCGERVLGEKQIRSNKLTRLLVYILMNRNCVLSHQKLIEVFWEDESRNPEGALKNAVYRLRNILKALGEENYISTLQDAYQWNPEICVESDYEKFEALNKGLRETDEEGKKKVFCRELIDCYGGNVSAKLAIEEWMMPKVIWYQSIYMDAIKMYCKILEQEKQWSELEMNCNRALLEDPVDEDVHCWLLTSLHKQKKYDQVITQYENSKKIFYRNIGISFPKRISERFQKILSEEGEGTAGLDELVDNLREAEKPTGTFFCDYQIFRQMYRIEARRSERLGVAEHLLLLTLRKKDFFLSEKQPKSVTQDEMDILEECIRSCLRTGDVATRYSAAQFLILLSMCSYESGLKVAERIREGFRKRVGKNGVEIVYELTDLSAGI